MRVAHSLGLSVALILAGAATLVAQAAPRPLDTTSVAEARALLKALVETNTTRDHGSTTAAARLVADRFLHAGWPSTDVEIAGPSPTRQNLVVRWRASSPASKPVLFMSHLDVVEAKREDWDSDPFVLREKDGYLYGRGVLDDKAAVATWTTGLIALHRAGWRPSRDIVLLLTADEEGGDENGIEWLLRNRRALFDVDFVINADAAGPELHDGKVTLFAVDVAEKSPMTIDLTVTNPGGHSSRPRSDNAIYSLAHALVRIEQYRFPVQLGDLQRVMSVRAAETAPAPVAEALRAIVRDPSDSAASAALERVPHLNAMLRTTCVATQLAGRTRDQRAAAASDGHGELPDPPRHPAGHGHRAASECRGGYRRALRSPVAVEAARRRLADARRRAGAAGARRGRELGKGRARAADALARRDRRVVHPQAGDSGVHDMARAARSDGHARTWA
jgi:hypothetical protein